jgi:1-acyl-sn-glycerol-3-phosphate acyltransferase
MPEPLTSLVGGTTLVARRLALRLASKLPANWVQLLAKPLDPDDLSSRDPDFIRESAIPVLDFLRTQYFRTDVEGAEHVPREGPFIAIANHNGGPMMPDLWVMLSYYWAQFGLERPAYAMVHDVVFQIPLLGSLLSKLGALRASKENADKVLDAGGVLLVYPGGELDCLRSFARRNVIDFHGRTGFIELAMRRGVPLVPVVNAGGHETAITLWSSRALARLTGLEALTRIKTVPVMMGLPWGLWVGGFVPFLPLPAKFDYRVGKPLRFRPGAKLHRDPEAVHRAYVTIVDSMQDMLDQLVSRRRLPVLG